MERVKKGEKYWYLDLVYLDVIETQEMNNGLDNYHYRKNNYFATREQAIAMAAKIRAVLKGAEVIEMPSVEEARLESNRQLDLPMACEDEGIEEAYLDGFASCFNWLKFKTVK